MTRVRWCIAAACLASCSIPAAAEPKSLIEPCDRAAAVQTDPDRPAEIVGVASSSLSAMTAVPACRAALSTFDDRQEPKGSDFRRILAQLARSLAAARMFDEAISAYQKAAALGSANAMTGVGTLYKNGTGVGRDYQAAKSWFEKAIGAGDIGANNGLAQMYYEGLGVRRNYDLARLHFEKAALAGDTAAMGNLGNFYATGKGTRRNYALARNWYESAAEKGDARAMMLLGTLHEDGKGVRRDRKAAKAWFEKSLAAGHLEARQAILRVSR